MQMLGEECTETGASALHPHFERRNSNAGYHRHFFKTQFVGKTKYHGLTLFPPKHSQRASKPRSTFGATQRRVRAVTRFGQVVILLSYTGISSITRATGPALVYDDAKHPGAEMLLFPVPSEMSVRANEGLLDCIVGVVGIAKQSRRNLEAPLVVPVDKERKGFHVTGHHSLYDQGIRYAHAQ